MRIKEFITQKIILEGGKMFSAATPFDQKFSPQIIKTLNDSLIKTGISIIPVGSGATPAAGKMSGDFDVMADESAVAHAFNSPDAKSARHALKDYISKLGYETAQSGINVHVLVPLSDGQKAQVDIMVTPQANAISKFHQHHIPSNSPYKGVHKQILMSTLAKTKHMLWSPWQGLFMRTPDGKKGNFISNDINQVAQTLLGNGATAADLGSVESIFKKLPKQTADVLMDQLANDPNWKTA